MSTKQHFTITITDVHGAKHYSFSQLVKKFAWIVVSVFLVLVISAIVSIWFLNKQIAEIQSVKRQAEMSFLRALDERQNEYANLMDEKYLLMQELDEKVKQVGFLDQTLQGLEELIGVSSSHELPITERVKITQLTTLEKQVMLDRLPNGRPVSVFKGVSSGYGFRKHPISGAKTFHHGVDYRGDYGDPAIATADGVVEYAGYHKGSGYGNLVIISHAYGFKTFFGHLQRMNVKTGQYVNKGQVIGTIGSTGASTGPHLHYEVSFVQRKLNPAPFVQWSLEDYDSIFDKVEGVPWDSLSQSIRSHVEKVEKQLSLRAAQ